MRARNKCEVTNATIMLDRNQASRMFSLGTATIDKIAVECGAKVTIGRRVLYKRSVLESYFTQLSE